MATHTNKEVVIAMRDGLKAGCNWPVKVYADNTFVIINEAAQGTFTKWDDEMGIIYYFRLANPTASGAWTNKGYPISVCAVKYEFVQAMEVVPFPLEKVDDIMDSMEQASGNTMEFKDDFRKQIKHVFKTYMDPNDTDICPEKVNAMHGTILEREDLDYYSGKPNAARFKETADVRRYNEELAKTRAFQQQRAEALAAESGN